MNEDFFSQMLTLTQLQQATELELSNTWMFLKLARYEVLTEESELKEDLKGIEAFMIETELSTIPQLNRKLRLLEKGIERLQAKISKGTDHVCH